MTNNDTIDDKLIRDCEANGACPAGFDWLRAKPRTFAELRAHSLPWYIWLAQHTSDAEVMDFLAADPVAGVRGEVARNPSTPVATLEKLAADPDAWVRCEAEPRL